MSKSKIQWTDRTWMVTGGCSKVTTACDRCYAIPQSHRSSAPGRKYHGLTKRGKRGTEWTGKIKLFEHALADPYTWRKPCRVFVNSLSDLFHPDVPFSFIQRVFNTMLSTPHTYQVLTKRPERMAEFIDRIVWNSPKNIHLGFSAHDQPSFDAGWKHMQGIPCAVRFVSLEPLLGPVDLAPVLKSAPGRVGWVIVGGESGPGARPSHPDWFRKVRDDCQAAGVPLFFKQWGEWVSIRAYSIVETLIVKYKDDLSRHFRWEKDMCLESEWAFRVGKKAARDFLDGRQYHQFPFEFELIRLGGGGAC